MTSKHTIEDKTLYITIEGDIIGEDNGADIMEIAQKVLHKPQAHCVVDIENVRYINSSGIGVLITLLTKFQNNRGQLILVKPSDHVMKLLTIIKLQNTFTITDSVDEATQKLKE